VIDLASFCSTDESRVALHQPWSVDGFTYATDDRIIVRLQASEFPSEPNDRAPKSVHTIQKWNHAEIADWLDLPADLPSEDKFLPCGNCDGDGEHYCKGCEDFHECGKCGGEGRKYHPSPINIGLAKIDAKYLRKIAALPEARIENPSESNVAVAFKFNGGVGYVMPIRTE
jgi:hypothetical protein